VAFDSDSSSYETALRYFEAVGKEVVICTNSFISVPNSVVTAGAKAVFADIKANSLSMDPESLQRNITKDTCGVIVTHISGFPNPDLYKIKQICREHNLFLIEDATHAIGASVNGKKAGTFGDAAVFSFTPTKVITTGEGGMLVSDNTELCEFAKRFSFYGSGIGKTNFVDLGRHMVLPEVAAAMGLFQLRRLDEFVAKRNQIAKRYNETLDGNEAFKIVHCANNTISAYYKYPLILNPKIDKLAFTGRLFDEFGVETGNIFYPPCHMQGVYRKLGALCHDDLFVSEDVLARTVTLPMHVALSDSDVDYVIDKVLLLAKQT